MRLLLDTHAFLWWLAGHSSLPGRVRAEIDTSGADVFVSAASTWEITTKYRLGKLPQAEPVARDVMLIIESQQFTPLAISVKHGQLAGALAGHHRDPFDRMLVAQAQVEGVPVVTRDPAIAAHGVPTVW